MDILNIFLTFALIMHINQIKSCFGHPDADTHHLNFHYDSTYDSNLFPERRVMRLDPEGKVKLGWLIDPHWQTAIFDLTIATNGFVGFGLNTGTGMTGADILIGGVYGNNGSVYFLDCIGTGNTAPKIDDHHDWELLDISEGEMYTSLRFARRLDTMDKEDVPIKNETINLIYAYGPMDGFNYHEGNRGSVAINLFDPKFDFSKFQKFGLTLNTILPTSNQSHTFWCTLFKGPMLSKKSHIVAFKPLLNGPMAEKHVHHLAVSKCWVPPGSKPAELYDKFLEMGEDCFGFDFNFNYGNANAQTQPMVEQKPFHLCQSVLYAWGLGERNSFVPEHTDYHIGEDPNEYFMLEVQYFNPNQETSVKFETGVDMFYTA